MSESTDPQTRAIPAPEEMPWSISYLHDDIQALRIQSHADIQALRAQSHADIQALYAEIGVVHKRIDETNRVLSEQIRAVHKRMDTYFLWMMGTLVAVTGVLIAVIKL